jgi:hypothetical protein
MRAVRSMRLMLAAGLLALLGGCVELDGQRFSWCYDPATDELQILIHYDGVHDSGNDKYGKGAEQIPKFVRDGDVMVLDWPFQFSREAVRRTAAEPAGNPQERKMAQAIARLVEDVRIEPIGYYREPDGKMGAAQRITIPRAKSFVKKVNELINTGIVEELQKGRSQKDQPKPSSMPRTLERIEAAAKSGHQWVTLDGQAVRVVVPVHPGEWNRAKGETIADAAKAIAGGDEKFQKSAEEFMNLFRVCAFTPLGYLDRGDEIEVVIGRAKTTSTLRAEIRDGHKPNLENAIVETVKTDLDEQLAAALLDEDAKPSPAIAAVLKFGPPEDQVRALITAFEKGDAKKKEAVVERLNRFAAEWNRDRVVPEAPKDLPATTSDLTAWKEWYAAVKHYPPAPTVKSDTPASPAEPKKAEEPQKQKK